MSRTPISPRRSRPAQAVLPVLVIAAAIGVWWLAALFLGVPDSLLPSPGDVGYAFVEAPDYLLDQAVITMVETLIGYLIATVAGLTLAIAIASSETFGRAVMPLLVALHAIPKVALAPLLIVWLGFGPQPKVAMVALISFFPIMLPAVAGLNATPADLGELATSLSATRWQTFIKIRFPWALPQIFTGLKVGITLAVTGAVVAEIFNPDSGLGAALVTSGASADTARAFAAITLLAVLSTALFSTLAGLERLLLRWARETSTQPA